jgi:hypothetical protein
MDDELRAELADNLKLLDDLAEQAGEWQAERDQLADVLKGPGVRKLLLCTYHSDQVAGLSATGRKELDTFAAQIIAAYDLIDAINRRRCKPRMKRKASRPGGCNRRRR